MPSSAEDNQQTKKQSKNKNKKSSPSLPGRQHCCPQQLTVSQSGRGLFFAREDKTYLIGTYQCVTYLRDIINFICILVFSSLEKIKSKNNVYGHTNVCYLELPLLKFGITFA